MIKERFKLKVGVLLVLKENDSILLLRRYNTGVADGVYVFPMGGLEEGETVTEAIVREAKEEINVILKPESVRVVHVMHRLHHLSDGTTFPQVDFFFMPREYSGVIKNMEPHKHDQLKFYPLDALPDKTGQFIRQAIECIQREQFYSEIGWPKKYSEENLSPTIYFG